MISSEPDHNSIEEDCIEAYVVARSGSVPQGGQLGEPVAQWTGLEALQCK
jgi:hypothetical protein